VLEERHAVLERQRLSIPTLSRIRGITFVEPIKSLL